jgi:hypothetical protein
LHIISPYVDNCTNVALLETNDKLQIEPLFQRVSPVSLSSHISLSTQLYLK